MEHLIKTIYEQPLNERIRTFLRLEEIFKELEHYQHEASAWDSRAIITIIIELITIFERGDLKLEVIKELERHIANLTRLQSTPEIDTHKLQNLLDALHKNVHNLHCTVGKIGQELKDIDLIASVRQRVNIPGGTCNFDMPMYHYWLQQSPEFRNNYINEWLQPFLPIKRAINLILKLTRESAIASTVVASNGFYQQPLEQNNPCQLVRVGIINNEDLFPEVSGSKHRISIRFLLPKTKIRPVKTNSDINFELSCCMI